MPDRPLLKLLDVVSSGGPSADAETRAMAREATASIGNADLRERLAKDVHEALVRLQLTTVHGDRDRAVTSFFDLASRVEDAIMRTRTP